MYRTTAYRRHKEVHIVIRKMEIAQRKYGKSASDIVPGTMRKGKPYCCCPMCTIKTNQRGKRGSSGRGTHLTYNEMLWKHSEKKKLAQCDYQDDLGVIECL